MNAQTKPQPKTRKQVTKVPTPKSTKSKPTQVEKETEMATQAKTNLEPKEEKFEVHPSLKKFVQDPEVFLASYVGRSISGIEDMEILAVAHKLKHNVILSGPTGSAKTTLVYAYGAKVGLPVININCNGAIDPRALFGGWVPDTNGGYKFVAGDLAMAVMHGGIILINECNFAPAKILAALYGLLDRRRDLTLSEAAGSDFPTTVHAHPKTMIIADYNPDYIGTRPLSEAFLNRFAIKLHWDYSRTVEDELISCPTLQDIADRIREMHKSGDLSGNVPTNAMLEFLDFAEAPELGIDFAISNFVASFGADEQKAVQEVFALNYDNLLKDLGISV